MVVPVLGDTRAGEGERLMEEKSDRRYFEIVNEKP
jgi:hypothetical protein